MAQCPNINLQEWKDLVSSRGESIAYFLWDKYSGEVPQHEYLLNSNAVNYALKSVNILATEKAKQVFAKGEKNGWDLNRILTELQIPKEQKQLILNRGFRVLNNNDARLDSEPSLREQIITDLLANYSYTVEINTAKTKNYIGEQTYQEYQPSQEEIEEANKNLPEYNTQYYSNLTVPGGTNYTENEIATPVITPSIKGHAQFSTDNGIGWFRSDEQVVGSKLVDRSKELTSEEIELMMVRGATETTIFNKQVGGSPTKNRRILEVQSDLFQKGRDKETLVKGIPRIETGNLTTNEEDIPFGNDPIKEYKDDANSNEFKSNQFLQLLNKDNNWVTFFVKSIIQDSAKKGYEKVLFPLGNTASKIEGHTTLEEFKKQKENRIKELEDNTIPEWKNKIGNINPETYFNMNMFNSKSKREQEKLIRDEEQKLKNEIEGFNREINQLKQELERVETEGFGALKPIYNFYENTVANILKKNGYNPVEITDEYGNTWNEISLEEQSANQPILLQLEDNSMTAASEETVANVKAAALKMGIKINTLTEYAKENPDISVNQLAGVANLVKGVIAVAEGHEDTAITEEIVHIATAILEQVNPTLITNIISKIGNYKIFKEVFEQYKGLKAYQTADGKPDIRKIKKEAADKIIAELIVAKLEGSERIPELFQKESRNLIQRIWDTILEAIRSLYKQSDVDLFKSVADQIIAGDVGATFQDVQAGIEQQHALGSEYYQVTPNEAVNKIFDTIKGYSKRMSLVDKTANDKRHYLIDGERIAQSVTEKLRKSHVEDSTDAMRWGTEGHVFLDKYITNNLIDENGYKKHFTNRKIKTDLSEEIQMHIIDFAEKLISSYPEGTRFLTETMAVNERVKGKLASTIDFMAIIPTKDRYGKDDFKLDILDWKFAQANLERNQGDISWYKQDDWKKQMGEYTQMMYNYGVKRGQIGKARMIPFITKYSYNIPNIKNSGLVLTGIEIGDINDPKNTELHLLGVALDNESTGNKQIDKLLLALRTQLDKMYNKTVDPTEKHIKFAQLAEIRKAIKKLHIQQDFEPLHNLGKTFINNVKEALKPFKDLDFDALTEDELRDTLGELADFVKSAEKFTNLEKVYASTFSEGETMSGEEASLYRKLSVISSTTEDLLKQILNIQREFAVHLSVKLGFIDEANKDNILRAERPISNMYNLFMESSKINSRITNMVSNMIQVAMKTKSVVVNKKIQDFGKILLPLEAEASRLGKSAFDLIGKVEDGTLKLIQKINPEFIKQVREAFANNDKQFLLDNLNLEEYNKLAKEAIRKSILDINNTTYSTEEADNLQARQIRIAAIKRNLLIEELDFDGYDSRFFKFLYYKAMKEEGNYSDEYKRIVNNKAIHDVWQFFTDMNIEAKEMGYLDDEGASFFPLIEATMIDKIAQSRNLGKQAKDFFDDLYKVRLQEAPQYGKLDLETGKIIEAIPKYYTSTDKKAEQLSRDLNKVGAMWIDALEQYKTRTKLEDVVQTLYAVEKSKGVLAVDEQTNKLIFSGDEAQVLEGNETNARILKAVIDDFLYDIREDASSLGNIALQRVSDVKTDAVGAVVGKGEQTLEDKYKAALSIKKSMRSANTLVVQLALGLKYAVGVANWVGTQMQTYIKSGNFYTFEEYTANNLKVTTGVGLTTIEKGLLNLFIPLNENIANESRRKIARQQGLVKWLGTWTFTEVMMSTLQVPERKLQFANGLSFIDNTMIDDNGQLVNIRQYIKAQDREAKKGKTFEQRKAIDNTFEERVKRMKETKGLAKVAKFENDKLVLPGVSDEAIGRYRTKMIEYHRTLSGMMDQDNKMAYRRDTLFSSFMMFKSWIPKLVSVRAQDLKKNNEIGEWEYGRMRAFVKAWVFHSQFSITKLMDMVSMNDRGIQLINEMLQEKKNKYFLQTGQDLEISEAEYQELVSSLLRQQFRELGVLFGTLALVLAAKAAEPPEESSLYERNFHKHVLRQVNKIYEEIWFYYDPTSTEAILQGSLLPAVGLLTKAARFTRNLGQETYGQLTGDLDMIKKAKPLKYFINLFPIGSQIMNEILPLIDPELAREMGVITTSESRRN